MTYKMVCTVKDNQIVLTLPPDLRDKKEVTIIIDDHVDSKSLKIEILKMASTDKLFLADVQEIQQDFDSIDHETL